MNGNNFNASDLVISVLAHSTILNESVTSGRLSEDYLTKRICAKYPSEVLSYAGIRPHELHKDSEELNLAMANLVQRGVIGRDSSSSVINWKHPDSPSDYYATNIAPNLSTRKRRKIEEFSREVN